MYNCISIVVGVSRLHVFKTTIMSLKETGIKILNKLPYIRGLYAENQRLKSNSHFYPGHFFSPVVSVKDIEKRATEIWGKPDSDSINAIDLHTDEQIKLVQQLTKYYAEMPFGDEKKPNLRYQFVNDAYGHTDGIVLYSMMRHLQPKRMIEIGSGFSSAVMLDTNQLFFSNSIQLTFIDPYPKKLYTLINENDKKSSTIIASDVQVVKLEVFEELEAGDILFVDSTHVVKTDSDVNYILFEILPRLKSGVIIHFHDIFYPFEYPKEWVLEGRNWNEDYFLKSFLMYNEKFKMILFSDYLHKLHKDAFKGMPLCYKNSGGNIWLEKL